MNVGISVHRDNFEKEKTMPVTPYLMFDGRCEEAIEFYKKNARREGRDDDAL